MHHPGSPRFLAVGESVQLAPRDPDPTETYRWRIKQAPVTSRASVGDDAVVEFAPDVPGTYVVELDAPDGVHALTLRVFPGEARPGTTAGRSGESGVSGVSGSGGRPGVSGGVSGSGSAQADAEADGGGRPRVRLDATVEGDVLVVRADPRPNPRSSTPREELDVEFLLDDRDGVDPADVVVDGWEMRIPLSAVGDRLRVHAVAVGETYSVPDAVDVRREHLTDGGVDDGDVDVDGRLSIRHPNDPPEWATEVTLYEIYVRGYAEDDEEAETTFEALEKRLEYLEELGVDCLWLTPVLQNDHAPHGYNITDFFAIAKDLGTREDYESFVEAAHDHGMKVLFDLVLNHSAREHPFFQDAYRNPDSEYYDWYEWQESGEPGTYFDWEYIANFDHTNLKVRRHLLDAVDQWFEIADGFRCDMAWAVPESFWQEIRDRVKSRDPEFLLLDETIPYIPDFHEGMFDMHFDTTLYFALRQVGRGDADADALLDAIEQRAEVGFPDHAAFMLYQENHDETRYIVECGDEAAFASAGALFTLPGVPMLYGGQELGQRGRRDHLAWDHAREEVRDHYEHLLELRDETRALGYRGDFARVEYDSDADGVTVFRRDDPDGDDHYVVALNFDDAPQTFTLGDELDARVDPTNAVNGRDVSGADGYEVESVVVLPVEER